ncbi:MAG TPA: NADH-quinone oxidoreductase subunit J [bacterium]|nr:NADH-quinone oxidoreductase subunit J [bacterium]
MTGFAILFYILAAMAAISATGVISFRNPIYSALSLVVTLISLAGLYVTLQGGFLGVIQVLTYAGAILVLFIFIIMLLNLEESELHEKGYGWAGKGLLGLSALGLFLALGYILTRPKLPVANLPAGFGEVAALGREMFGPWVVPFELAGILLTVALIGAVLLAKRKLETK